MDLRFISAPNFIPNISQPHPAPLSLRNGTPILGTMGQALQWLYSTPR